ncbi:hypothetical protein ATPR_3392 [Acetobacter tropicalis NBRC 101654]|uniref:Uncharacterized protein n=1 Tax=Acetobacter tropicalis NBRC 101654 TaxID=749388 RepID=F7VJ43_9PROT|nr:hypothetical protein ATPR_3392 [Acetobacter tropicalis NBRC 101654]
MSKPAQIFLLTIRKKKGLYIAFHSKNCRYGITSCNCIGFSFHRIC